MSPTQTAIKCFRENIELYASPPRKDPEKFNLYNGLANLSEAVADLEARIDRLNRTIRTVTTGGAMS